MDLTISPLFTADLPAALRLSTAAGWNQLEADWRRLLDLWPQFCLAGRVGGAVVATATLAAYPVGPAWVGMVLVDEAHRRRGYGGAMLYAALAAGRAAGARDFGLDATDQGRPVYLKRGFRDAAAIDRWVGEPPPAGAAGGAEVQPLEPSDWDSLLALDLAATGADRAGLLRHLAGEGGVGVRVHRAAPGGPVAAFAFARPGRTADHVGPVVAESEQSAAAVIDAVLSARRDQRRPVLVDVPAGRLSHWLAARSFRVHRRLTRMQTGTAAALASRRVFAAAGFELG